jgi:NADH-quinone oxidoreductase subunit J
VLVYAGAIMVLFIFVVMILNREEVAPLALRPMRLLGVAAGAYLLAVFANAVVVKGSSALEQPPVVSDSYGTVASIGNLLFRDFLYPFEAISLLLLVAIVGGVVVSRSHQKEVAAVRAADYRKQVEALAASDYPGTQGDEPAAAGGHH